jgi:hypothetical protein
MKIDSFFDELEKFASILPAAKFATGYLLGRALWGSLDEERKEALKDEAEELTGSSELPPIIIIPKEKSAALGVDLRLTGPSGIKRPPFPTEGSKGLSMQKFKQSRKTGMMGGAKPPRPSIRSVATKVG